MIKIVKKKDVSVVRMNFLRHRAAGFTYRHMMFIIVGWCLFLGLIGSTQILRQVYIGMNIKGANKELVEMNKLKEEQLTKIRSLSQKDVGKSVKENLTTMLESSPQWSKMLRYMTRKLPAQVWLDSLKIVEEKEKEGGYILNVEGKTKSQRALTNFILTIEKDGVFKNTEIISTKLEAGSADLLVYTLKSNPVVSKFGELD